MPIFDYRCVRCRTVYDVFHKTQELVEDIVCPKCASTEFVKLFSAPALRTAASAGPACLCGAGESQTCGDGGCGNC